MVVAVYKHMPAGQEDGEFKQIADGDTFTVEGATLRAVYTPGHTQVSNNLRGACRVLRPLISCRRKQDHMSFVLEEEAALFTGDCVLGCGSAVFENLRVYLQSLEVLAKRASPRARCRLWWLDAELTPPVDGQCHPVGCTLATGLLWMMDWIKSRRTSATDCSERSRSCKRSSSLHWRLAARALP